MMRKRQFFVPAIAIAVAVVLAVAGGWFALGNVADAQTDLTAPANVRAVQGSAIGQAVVSWDAVDGATGYTVRWVDLDAAWAAYEADGRWGHLIESKSVPASGDGRHTLNIPNLKTNTTRGHAFAVRTERDGAVSGWSDWVIRRLTAEVDFEAAVEILAAALEIGRHSAALVAADLPMERSDFPRYDQMVAGRKGALTRQLSVLDDSGHNARVGQIRALVDRLQSNVDAIRAQRPQLLTAVAKERAERQMLTLRNQTHLLPNTEATLDEDFYNLVTSADGDGSAGSGGVSRDDLLYYWHLDSLSSSLTVGSTFLQVASLMQGPEFVARIRETYDSIAGRLERDIEYLGEAGDSELQTNVLDHAEYAYNAGTGPDNYFDRLERRLTMVVDERDRVEDNEETLARLRDEIGRLTADVLGQPHPAPETVPETVVENPGVTASSIKFGQSADFSGGSSELGTGMRLGIRAAFQEAGTVNGRTLNLVHRDDGYEPDRAFANTQELINKEQVFALIGAVGTPTSRAVSPLAHAEEVPFIAPFTGAQLLREPGLTNVLNLRASYHQETDRMLEYLQGQGVTRVAVLYQNDSYGLDGLTGVKQQVMDRNMQLVESWYYRRNTEAVKSAVFRITEADTAPQAVIIIGASEPAAQAIKLLREKLGSSLIFMNVSFVGSDALAAQLQGLGESRENVFFTQVVPLPGNTGDPLIDKYQAALAAVDPQAQPGFVSLEGYLAGRLAIYAVDACGQNVTRTCFLNAVQTAGTFDLDGFELMFGAADNQGSEAVFLTQIDANGQYTVVP